MPPISIPLMRSTFFAEAKTRQALADFILHTPRMSMGEQCAGFEKAFGVYQERKYAVLVCNGSAANLGLIQALMNLGRLSPGDAVGVSAVTWATNVMPLMQLGLQPVAIDCSIDTLNMSSTLLEPKLKGLKALFITNALGFCDDLDVIRSMCESAGVLLLEDNCESLGTRYKGTLLGNFGSASTFSFFVGHHLSTIEGGMICTDDEELYHMLLMVRAHGWDRPLPAHVQRGLRDKHGIDDFHAQYTFYESAYNIRPTEITGFLGQLQLPLLEATIDRRSQNFARFLEVLLSKPEQYYPLVTGHIERVSNFAMPVITRSPEMFTLLAHHFTQAGVEVRPVIAGDVTLHPFWKKSLPSTICQNARIIHGQGLYFPNNADLTPDEVGLLCSLLSSHV